jgi:hypothetical protein
MESNYSLERKFALDTLAEQVAFLVHEMAAARLVGDMKDYAALMRLYLPAQKEYLRLCAEEGQEGNTDALTEFTSKYDTEGLTVL